MNQDNTVLLNRSMSIAYSMNGQEIPDGTIENGSRLTPDGAVYRCLARRLL